MSTEETRFDWDGFKPMLAAKFDERRVGQYLPVIMQPKFDGIRATLTNLGPRTRSLKKIPNKYIYRQMEVALNTYPELKWFDGEIMLENELTGEFEDYNTVQSAVMASAGTPNFVFYAFDIVDPNTECEYRMSRLFNIISGLQNNLPWLRISPMSWAHSVQEVLETEEKYLKFGYEGAIIRRPDSLYKFNRATPLQGQLIKMKRFEDSEGIIIGVEELQHNDNEAFTDERGYTVRSSHLENLRGGDMLGYMIVKAMIDGVEVHVRLGSGFSRAQRIEIWDNQAEYIGKRVKFKHFAHGAKGKPRHPIFLGFRSGWDL